MEAADIESGIGVGTKKEDEPDDAVAAAPAAVSSPPPLGGLSLYHEILQALLFSNLIMCIPPLRDWGREGVLQGDPERLERLEHLPCTVADIVTIFQDNQELLTKEGGILKNESKCILYQQALGLQTAPDDERDISKVMFGPHSYHEVAQDLEIVVISDHRQQTDIVYMVAVSHVRKQCWVIFRGSTTQKDYKQDAKMLLAEIQNPIDPKHQYLHREEELGMHLGFREYLYTEEKIAKVLFKPKIYKKYLALVSSLGGDKDNEQATTQAAEQIAMQDPKASVRLTRKHKTRDLKKSLELPQKHQLIIEQVLDVIDEHDDYRLFCTGHSLGAALAVAMAFEAAADERIPAPVTCVNTAAPKVGNAAYLRAFTYLERQGRLRCAQVSNNRDIIPKFPLNGTVNVFAATCWPSRTFRHVGLQVELCDKAKYSVRIPPKHETCCGMFIHDVVRLFRFWVVVVGVVFLSANFIYLLPVFACCVVRHGIRFDEHHSQNRYKARLENCREDLEQRTIEELNERRWKRPRYKVPVVHRYNARKKAVVA